MGHRAQGHPDKSLSLLRLILFLINVYCVLVWVRNMHAVAQGGQKRASDPLRLELQAFFSELPHVAVGD